MKNIKFDMLTSIFCALLELPTDLCLLHQEDEQLLQSYNRSKLMVN